MFVSCLALPALGVGGHADSHAHVNDMREDGKDPASDEVSSTAPSSPVSDDSP